MPWSKIFPLATFCQISSADSSFVKIEPSTSLPKSSNPAAEAETEDTAKNKDNANIANVDFFNCLITFFK